MTQQLANPFLIEWNITTKAKRRGNQYYIPIPVEYKDRLIGLAVFRGFDEFYKETIRAKVKYCGYCKGENDIKVRKCQYCRKGGYFLGGWEFKEQLEVTD